MAMDLFSNMCSEVADFFEENRPTHFTGRGKTLELAWKNLLEALSMAGFPYKVLNQSHYIVDVTYKKRSFIYQGVFIVGCEGYTVSLMSFVQKVYSCVKYD